MAYCLIFNESSGGILEWQGRLENIEERYSPAFQFDSFFATKSEQEVNKKCTPGVHFSIVAEPGFEPRQTESESVVLPLYYSAIVNQDRKSRTFLINTKFLPHFLPKNCSKSLIAILSSLTELLFQSLLLYLYA